MTLRGGTRAVGEGRRGGAHLGETLAAVLACLRRRRGEARRAAQRTEQPSASYRTRVAWGSVLNFERGDDVDGARGPHADVDVAASRETRPAGDEGSAHEWNE